jgi:hypothetical protein
VSTRSRRRAPPFSLASALLAFLLASPLLAQPPRTDTIKTSEQLIRSRLKNLGPLVRRDTTGADTLVADSARRDSVIVRQGPQRVPITNLMLTGRQRDSTMMNLLLMSGFRAIEYKGERALFAADSSRLELRDSAEVLDNGQLVRADSSLIYWEPRSLACAYGKPEVSGAGTQTPITGDSLCYNTATRIGFVKGASTTVSEGANWLVRGDVYVVGNNYYAHDALFTDCTETAPHYHFAAKDMKVTRGNIIVARNVTLKFGDVPVFWLPFFVQSMDQGRRSGLLMPRFSINDVVRNTSRYNRRIEDVGFFWAISEFMGAELAMDWFSNNWTGLRGSFDYDVRNRYVRGGATVRHFWEQGGAKNFTLSTSNSWLPDERTNLSMNANYTTSSRFVRQQTFDPRELNRSIDSNAGVSRRFNWGSVNMGLARNHYLTDNTVNLTPSVGVNLSSIALFPALPGAEKWYSNANWTASANARMDRKTISIDNPTLSLQSSRNTTGSVNSSFTVGQFAWSQTFNFADMLRDPRTYGRGAVPDSIDPDTLPPLPRRLERRMNYSTGLSWQQRLWSALGNTTLTPSLSLRGETLEGDTTGGARIAAPMRIDFSSSLQTALYGFVNGIGPVQRVRHRISPSITYTYSPKPRVNPQQQQFFGVQNVEELNRLSIGINQTFEAKLRQRSDTAPTAPVVRDTLLTAEDSIRARVDTTAMFGGARRRDTGPPAINLLSITTDAVVYDFVQARKGQGVQTMQITNSIQSDLLRGLQLSITHELYDQRIVPGTGTGGTPPQRTRDFSPHLSAVNASFSLNSNSGLLRMLGLGRRQGAGAPAPADTVPPAGVEQRTDLGLIGRPRGVSAARPQNAAIGSWNANFNYSLSRPRPVQGANEFANPSNQQLTATVNFQPTENWSVNWNTSYSFTRGEFSDHILSLTRTLHDWDASFDFVKAQNGNFSFQFRVHLRANPDIKVDYEQRDRPPAIIR